MRKCLWYHSVAMQCPSIHVWQTLGVVVARLQNLRCCSAARVKSEWTPKGIERLEELDASPLVDVCDEIRASEKDASLLVKGVEANKALALAILRHSKNAWTNPKTRELVEWLIVRSTVVRGLFREESDVAVGYTISKLKKLLREPVE